ncbi:MAG: Rod shape-determining protein MreC [Acidimicrobiales bacterium]|nr:Rod shape-determining protein MreC [Acidimicrobiales bacterium]
MIGDQLDDAIRSVIADITAVAPGPDDLRHLRPVRAQTSHRARWLLPAVGVAVAALLATVAAIGFGVRRTTTTAPVDPTGAPAVSLTTIPIPTTERPAPLTGLPTDYPTVQATVTATPGAAATSVEIDRGGNDGIEVGMAVVDAAGLVGDVTAMQPTTSTVRLVTDLSYSIACVVDNVGAECSGIGAGQQMRARSLATAALPAKGHVTTGGGAASTAPPGIVIGDLHDGAIDPAADLAALTSIAVVLYAPADAFTPQPTMTPTTTTVVAGTDPWLPPGFTLPTSIAILDPGPPGDIPIRDNPITDWLQHGNEPAALQRWFVERDSFGAVTGGVSVSAAPVTESSRPAGGPVDISGLDARLLRAIDPKIHVIQWTAGGLTFSAGSLGDIDVAQLTRIVGQFASATTLVGLPTPDGFSELAAPTEVSTVDYASAPTGNPDLIVAISHVGPAADLQAIASMTAGRTGPVTPTVQGNGYQTTMFEGSPVLVFPAGPDTIAQVFVYANVDPSTIANAVRTVATDTVAARPTYASSIGHDLVPPTAPPQFGKIGGRRFVGYSYTNEAGAHCVNVEVSGGGGATRCAAPLAATCSWIERPADRAFVAVIPSPAKNVEILFDGQPAAATVEQHDGFTLASGASPLTYNTATITVDGAPVCVV